MDDALSLQADAGSLLCAAFLSVDVQAGECAVGPDACVGDVVAAIVPADARARLAASGIKNRRELIRTLRGHLRGAVRAWVVQRVQMVRLDRVVPDPDYCAPAVEIRALEALGVDLAKEPTAADAAAIESAGTAVDVGRLVSLALAGYRAGWLGTDEVARCLRSASARAGQIAEGWDGYRAALRSGLALYGIREFDAAWSEAAADAPWRRLDFPRPSQPQLNDDPTFAPASQRSIAGLDHVGYIQPDPVRSELLGPVLGHAALVAGLFLCAIVVATGACGLLLPDDASRIERVLWYGLLAGGPLVAGAYIWLRIRETGLMSPDPILEFVGRPAVPLEHAPYRLRSRRSPAEGFDGLRLWVTTAGRIVAIDGEPESHPAPAFIIERGPSDRAYAVDSDGHRELAADEVLELKQYRRAHRYQFVRMFRGPLVLCLGIAAAFLAALALNPDAELGWSPFAGSLALFTVGLGGVAVSERFLGARRRRLSEALRTRRVSAEFAPVGAIVQGGARTTDWRRVEVLGGSGASWTLDGAPQQWRGG